MTSRASAHEVNFDCLVGPTHHFGGLSFGNLASTKNKSRLSSPRRAALQGLAKMRYLSDRGFVQAVLPPHERPHFASFRNLGFSGAHHVMMREAFEKLPQIFSSLCSSSAMWAANAATISPSFDSLDEKLHISPANLITMVHRSIEADFAHHVFARIFANTAHFVVHPPLLPHDVFSDEGAANHSRLAPHHNQRGLQIFVYGKESTLATQSSRVYPSRQSRLANTALALRHRLQDNNFVNVAQNPAAIDHGAFHNDVVAVANQNILLCHELAYFEQKATLDAISERYAQLFHEQLHIVEIKNDDLPIADAVSSYLFNSQLLTKPTGGMLLFAPMECKTNERARAMIARLLDDNGPINEVAYFDVSESMANGGGPACLRLRVLLTEQEIAAVLPSVFLTERMSDELTRIINTFYVDELTVHHFFDESFLQNCQTALDEIASVLGIRGIYEFQK